MRGEPFSTLCWSLLASGITFVLQEEMKYWKGSPGQMLGEDAANKQGGLIAYQVELAELLVFQWRTGSSQ